MSEWYDIPSEEMTLEQARSAVKELRKKVAEQFANMQNEWISVKDRLPDKDGFYLAYYTFKDGRHACDIFYHNCCGTSISSAITHWMILPESPKENNNET